MLIKVPYLDQTAGHPTGCESVSAVMLLRWLGCDIGIDEFIDRYLDKEDFITVDGELFGADPGKAFAGDPRDPSSMGCYPPVIVKALERVFDSEKMPYRAYDLTGKDIAACIEESINIRKMPVLVWTTIDMKPAQDGPWWKLKDGTDFMWRSNEHCVLVTGIDDNCYICNDPWNNNGIVSREKGLFLSRCAEQGLRAAAVERRE